MRHLETVLTPVYTTICNLGFSLKNIIFQEKILIQNLKKIKNSLTIPATRIYRKMLKDGGFRKI